MPDMSRSLLGDTHQCCAYIIEFIWITVTRPVLDVESRIRQLLTEPDT